MTRKKKCIVCKEYKELSKFYSWIVIGKKQVYIYCQCYCKLCSSMYNRKYQRNRKIYLNSHPWEKTYESIKRRCYYEKDNRYYKKGIKLLITKEELKFLWFRDKAYLMQKPNIHRKNNNDNYTLSNCKYIEKLEHCISKNNGNFKGGLPHCPVCGKELSDYKVKSCRKHIKEVRNKTYNI